MSKSKRKETKNSTSAQVKPVKISSENQLAWWKDKKLILGLLLCLVVTFVSFSDSLNNEYVNWDDDRNFQENKLITSLNADNFWENTREIFTTDVIGGFNPLTIWTFAIENKLYGMDADSWKWWHLDNVLLHMVCVFFVFLLGRQLGLSLLGTCLLTLLFGIHPMRVESVAWLTERKDVLFGAFYFAALFYYIKGKKLNKEFKYIAVIIPLFFLSGLSKIQAVSLPLSMIAIDYYLDGKFSRQAILNKIPYFIISLIIGSLGFFLLKSEGVLSDNTNFSFFQRLFIGSYSYMIYLGKLIYPWIMSPLYPYPSTFETQFYLSAIPFFGLVAGLIYMWKKGLKVWVFGFLFFTFNVMFVLQILGAGQGFLADRFTYIPYFGLFFIAAFYFDKVNWRTLRGKIIIAIVALYMLLFAYKTYKQVDIWSNSYSLWTHVIQYFPNTKVTWGNRANWLRDAGYKDLALADYTQRLKLGVDDPEPFNSRAKLFFQSQNRDTLVLAYNDYTEAIRLAIIKGKSHEKLLPEYYVNQASTLARLNNLMGAIESFNKAELLEPNNPNIYFNRSITYHNMGNYQMEQQDIIKYLEFRPYDGAMISNLGSTKRLLGDPQGAEADFDRALRYSQLLAIYEERARNYIALGKFNEAKQDALLIIQNGQALADDLRQKLGM